jgi:signal recognition particle receptor subunit beta
VVDSNDSERIEEASQELNDVLSSPELDGVPLVVICNKQDLPNAVPASEIVTRMKLDKLRNRAWLILPLSLICYSPFAICLHGIYFFFPCFFLF